MYKRYIEGSTRKGKWAGTQKRLRHLQSSIYAPLRRRSERCSSITTTVHHLSHTSWGLPTPWSPKAFSLVETVRKIMYYHPTANFDIRLPTHALLLPQFFPNAPPPQVSRTINSWWLTLMTLTIILKRSTPLVIISFRGQCHHMYPYSYNRESEKHKIPTWIT